MGTWSISPNILASIDNNGLAYFLEHDTDTSYRITYQDSECGTITKDINVFACDTPTGTCTGSTSSLGSCVSNTASSTLVQVGTWTANQYCSEGWSYDSSRSTSGTVFIDLSSIEFRNDGTIYARINSTNPSATQRECKIPTKLGSEKSDYFTITQCPGETPGTCTAYTSRISSCVSNTASSSLVAIGNWYKSQDCSGSWSYDSSRSVTGTNFIDTSSIEFRSDGKVYAKVNSNNPGTTQRECRIPTKLGSEKTDYIPVTQCAGEAPTGTCAGSTSRISSCVSNTASSALVQIGNWTKNQYCSSNWSYDSSRSVTGTNFIDTSSIEFRNDGKVYAKVNSTNTSSSQRSCQIPTKLGSDKTDYIPVIQCAGNVCTGSTSRIDTCVSSTVTSDKILIGNWSKSQYCSSNWSYDSSRSVTGTNFIDTSSIEFRSDGKVYAKVNSDNTSSSQRSCQIPTKLGSDKTDYLVVTQCAGGSSCSCSSAHFSVTGQTVSPGINLIVARYTANCDDGARVVYVGTSPSTDFLNNGSFLFNNGDIIYQGKVLSTTSDRHGDYAVYIGSTRCDGFTVTQNGEACSNCNDVGIYGLSAFDQDASGKTGAVLANFNTQCDPSTSTMTVQKTSGDMVVNNIGLKKNRTGNWSVTGDVTANSSTARKSAAISINMAGSSSSCTAFTVNQNVSTFTVTVTISNQKSTNIYVDKIRFRLGDGSSVIGSAGLSYEISRSGSREMTVTLDVTHNGKKFTSFNAMDTQVAQIEYTTNNTGGTLGPGARISGTVS